MAKRNIECFDPKSFNMENLPQVCGNDVFEKVEEYKKIEALRLRKTEVVELTTPISTSGTITEDTNGTNGSALSSYIPQLSDPVKTLCCKVHVFRDNTGQGHFQANEAWRLPRLFEWVNWRYGSPNSPSDMPNPPLALISDTRVRFNLDERDVEYYDDTTLYLSTSLAALQAAAVARNPKTLDFINVYMTAGSLGGPAAFASLPSTSPGWDSWVVQLGASAPQSDPNFNGYDWTRANNLAHELGHVLNLMHTYSGGGASAVCTIGPDFLYDVFGTNPNTCPHLCNWGTNASVQETPGPNAVITNNLMGGNKDDFWISGLQAAMMHQALEQLSVKRYVATGCKDCLCCVAFMARGINHVSFGTSGKVLSYAAIDLNEGWGWTGGINAFVAPVSGIYHFSVSFVANTTGGTSGDVFVAIQKTGTSIARGWSAAAPGQRGTGCLSINVELQTGDSVRTLTQSSTGTTRHIAEYNFEGHLICGCC
jgi:hypothetical protein